MPNYDYVCDACRHKFEEFQSMKAAMLKKCPKCGKNKLRRLMGTGGGVLFKGSGFYQTDYKTTSPKETKKEAPKPDGGGCKPSCGPGHCGK